MNLLSTRLQTFLQSPRKVMGLFFLGTALFLAPALTAQSFREESIQTVLAAPQTATISSPIRARIAELALHNGDTFEAGQTLIRFDCTIEDAQLGQARAKLEAATATLEAREKLGELESISDLDLKLGRAEKAGAQASADEYAARIAQCDIKAPFKGRVTDRLANPHEFAENAQPLLRIASLERLQAQILIPSAWLDWLKTGTDLTLRITETGDSYPAKIVRIGGEIDPVSQSIPVVAELADDHPDLLPGMSGTAVFKVESPDPAPLPPATIDTKTKPPEAGMPKP